MLSSVVVVLLAILGLASAASPAQATYCSEDNLLRAFQHTPTPAGKYCSTQTGYPTFLAVTSYPATRLSSACSCFSRFPSESTVSQPPPTTACYRFSSTGEDEGIVIDIIITIDLTSSPCGAGSYKITNVCGSFLNAVVTFNAADGFEGPDDCFYPAGGQFADQMGFDFRYGSGGDVVNFSGNGASLYYAVLSRGDSDTYSGAIQSVSCSTTCPTS